MSVGEKRVILLQMYSSRFMCANMQAVSSDKEIAARHPGNLDIRSCFGDVFSLVRRSRRVLWKWAHLPQGGRQCMKNHIQSISICDSSPFPPLFSVFKFQSQISSFLSFISLEDEVIYTSSSDSFCSDVALGYRFTSQRALLKWLTRVLTLTRSRRRAFFLSKTTPSCLIRCPQTHLIFVEHKQQRGSFTLLTS